MMITYSSSGSRLSITGLALNQSVSKSRSTEFNQTYRLYDNVDLYSQGGELIQLMYKKMDYQQFEN